MWLGYFTFQNWKKILGWYFIIKIRPVTNFVISVESVTCGKQRSTFWLVYHQIYSSIVNRLLQQQRKWVYHDKITCFQCYAYQVTHKFKERFLFEEEMILTYIYYRNTIIDNVYCATFTLDITSIMYVI